MLYAAYEHHLNVTVLAGRAVLANFDGEHPALAVASEGGTVHIHWPHDVDKTQVLRLNYEITALAAGWLDTSSHRDILTVGTATNLLAYDVHHNKDIFFKDIADGVNALVIGELKLNSTPLVLAGGNCSLQGFDENGDEKLWTVTGDNVTAITLCDVDEDSELEVLVGSEDAEIRIYHQEEIVSEMTESDTIVALTTLKGSLYAYSLANGTIGVYDRDVRLWSATNNIQATAIQGINLDSKSSAELVVGWSNGCVEVRLCDSGEVVFRENMSASVSAILCGIYSMEEVVEVIVVAQNGHIRGLRQVIEDTSAATINHQELQLERKAIQDLRLKKNTLLRELSSYENNINTFKSGELSAGMIPPNTEISCTVGPNIEHSCLQLSMKATNTTLIKAAIVFGQGIFDGESLMTVPPQPSSHVSILIKLPKEIECDMRIQAIVGYRGSIQDHVFELSHKLPKFSSFVYAKPLDLPSIRSFVTVPLNDRLSRVILWLNQSFLLEYEQEHMTDALNIGFKSLRTGENLILEASHGQNGGQIRIQCDDMKLCGDIIHDLFAYLNVEHSTATASFPIEMETLRNVLHDVKAYDRIRTKLGSDVADSSTIVKSLVIRGEDARILEDMDYMVDIYSELFDLNSELLGEYNKRITNHACLMRALKQMNQIVQKAARLRVGKPESDCVAACRACIRNNNTEALFTIIKQGHD